jgi:hypothetical protein
MDKLKILLKPNQIRLRNLLGNSITPRKANQAVFSTLSLRLKSRKPLQEVPRPDLTNGRPGFIGDFSTLLLVLGDNYRG